VNQYTVTLQCAITGKQRDYLVTFSSEEALVRYFAWTKDRLIAVSDGWCFLLQLWRDHERKQKAKPDWERQEGTYRDPEAYDFMKDELL
jgi:hypothetical protein